ncbi:MAG: hypothetical protein AAFR11_05775 [Pseudomonadota bacterium]
MPARTPRDLRRKAAALFAEIGEDIVGRYDRAELVWLASLQADIAAMTGRLEAVERKGA